MGETTVVNVRDTQDFDVYIGRANAYYNLLESPFANPYRIGRGVNRKQAIDLYRAYLMRHPSLLEQIPALKGKTLGCWCAPDVCHGDVLAELADAS